VSFSLYGGSLLLELFTAEVMKKMLGLPIPRCPPGHQVFEDGPLVAHEVVDDRAPISDADQVHLEELAVHQQVEGFLLPGAPHVSVGAEAREELEKKS
jgi:hypothetical protein